MKNLIQKLSIISFLLNILVYPSVSMADEQVATVSEGDPAPFSGTLFNTQAAARFLTEIEFAEESCQIKIDRELDLQRAELTLTIDQLQASLDANQSIYEQTLVIKNNQIEFLENQNSRNRISPAWTFIGGVVAGSLVAIGTAHAINSVSSN